MPEVAPRPPIASLGWAATVGSLVMYFSFIDQIVRNLHGEKGSMILPAATCLCCALWVSYGWVRGLRDWPIVLANIPGVVLGGITFATAL
ncbi:SWEET family sugar transporter [Sphingomonas nostoxanthinifaciens]|uniref:SWEET family sugar transporter n=1 Tax=Sphingomonas nostoxanthinifaciens TaxID=2872652 RepID=UPI001CC212A8|nr:SWEET family sugar transporter [Sphingomonas nostoxanthinifaciens]UAK26302.1 SWEET family sugar transporter [Sphingomonas nostoxanthinifaciens]